MPFFILGHARSGTTALARLLNASNKLACIYYESNILVRLWQMLGRERVLEEPFEDLVVDFRTTLQYNLQERSAPICSEKIVFPSQAMDQLADVLGRSLTLETDITKIFQHVSEAFFHLFYDHADCRIPGDKVPDYSVIPDVITSPHPACRLFLIRRDPRAVVHSTLAFTSEALHLFASSSAFAMAVSLALRESCLNSFLDGFPKERLLRINHQEFYDSPLQVAEESLAFLGIPCMDEGIIGFLNQTKATQNQVKDWRLEMTDADQEAVNAVYAEFDVVKDFQPAAKGNVYSFYVELAAGLRALGLGTIQDPHKAFQHLKDHCQTKDQQHTLGLALIKLGDYYHMKTQFGQALFFFEKALGLLPEDPVLWYKYGALCLDMKYLHIARDAFQKTASLCPGNIYYKLLLTKAIYFLGRVARLAGDTENAIVCYRKANQLSPDFRLARNMLALLEH